MFFEIIGIVSVIAVITGFIMAFTHQDPDLQERIDEIEKHREYVKMQRENKRK